ncbi:GNAT family N-acetyltransferase [Noviherbaspirillum autotrophicum]|uniref:N-acetyltransferase domain-containing protein n=1 Tax=Noviherbaspirillum autotrophicum TaxID=709839 RepID=A0A0C2BYD9_9BURK|nr:hypothetical protein [Noviherbaspirillum autotrophicum]KIF83046.1 hypothetical protein TSA66_22960 [Noviherbaspirillum autotrophicum]
MPAYDIRAPQPDELRPLQTMLSACNIPSEAVTSTNLRDYLIVREGFDEKIIACIGMERHGTLGVVKHLAVAMNAVAEDWVTQLLSMMEDRARTEGIKQLFVMSKATAGYFEGRGYHRLDRVQYPELLRCQPRFADAAPDEICMTKVVPEDHRIDYDRPFPRMDGARPVFQIPRGWKPPADE